MVLRTALMNASRRLAMAATSQVGNQCEEVEKEAGEEESAFQVVSRSAAVSACPSVSR